jgi:hypothetical protein
MVRRLATLEKMGAQLDMNHLREFGYATYQLHIAPFSNLIRRNPPGWYSRDYFESMCRVLASWKSALERGDDEHYLALWVFHPRFARSQVVAAIGQRIERYRTLFKPRSPEPQFPQFLSEYRTSYAWKATWDYEPYWKDKAELTGKDLEYLRLRGAVEDRSGTDPEYLLPLGTVWISESRS